MSIVLIALSNSKFAPDIYRATFTTWKNTAARIIPEQSSNMLKYANMLSSAVLGVKRNLFNDNRYLRFRLIVELDCLNKSCF